MQQFAKTNQVVEHQRFLLLKEKQKFQVREFGVFCVWADTRVQLKSFL